MADFCRYKRTSQWNSTSPKCWHNIPHYETKEKQHPLIEDLTYQLHLYCPISARCLPEINIKSTTIEVT